MNYDGDEVLAGHYFRVLPPLVEVAPPGMAPCALGSLVQVLVNATGNLSAINKMTGVAQITLF